MKKIFAMLLALAMCFSLLTSCGSSNDADQSTPQTADASEKADGWWKEELTTVADGKLTVATSPDFAPYEFYAIDENGTPSLAGFDIALAGYIADYMGLELEIVTVDFDGVLNELATKSVDLGLAGLSPDPTRANNMDFSDLYYIGGQSLVTVQENADSITSFDDINSAEFSIGAQTGSIQLDLANEYTPDADIVSLPKVTDIINELLTGKEYAAFIETDVAKCYQMIHPELEIVLDVPYDSEGSAIGVSKDNEALMAGVNEAIAAALADGSMDSYIAEAYELATGEKYEGLLNEDGEMEIDEADSSAEADTSAAE